MNRFGSPEANKSSVRIIVPAPAMATLGTLGYAFNAQGQLRHSKTGEPYVFDVRPGDREFNQQHYDAVGAAVTEAVYAMLEARGLVRGPVPRDAAPGEPQTCIFHTANALTADKLMARVWRAAAELSARRS